MGYASHWLPGTFSIMAAGDENQHAYISTTHTAVRHVCVHTNKWVANIIILTRIGVLKSRNPLRLILMQGEGIEKEDKGDVHIGSVSTLRCRHRSLIFYIYMHLLRWSCMLHTPHTYDNEFLFP